MNENLFIRILKNFRNINSIMKKYIYMRIKLLMKLYWKIIINLLIILSGDCQK